MVRYLYKKNNTEYKSVQNIEQWLQLGFNFSVFDGYEILGKRFTSETKEFIDEINKLKMWQKLGAKL